MFIQTQSTPNPQSLMFHPGKPVMEVGSSDFPNARTAMTSPLAKALFGIEGTSCLYYCYFIFQHFSITSLYNRRPVAVYLIWDFWVKSLYVPPPECKGK